MNKMDNMNNTNVMKQYYFYLINNDIYVNYDEEYFYENNFENKMNLIRIGYEKTTDKTDYYLIDINSKIRQASLNSYPKFSVTLHLSKNNDIIKSYPYHGKNTTILKNNDNFIENKNIYPKYFQLDKNNKFIINTIIKYDKKLDKLINDISSQIYSQIFHLRMNLIQKMYEIEDYINDDDKTEFIKYNLGESQFSYDYYGVANKTIKLYNENVDGNYNCEDENEEENEEESNDDDYLPEIVKLNINLTNKILELENKIATIKNSVNIQNNNHNYSIIQLDKKYKFTEYVLMIYFIFFMIVAIFINYKL